MRVFLKIATALLATAVLAGGAGAQQFADGTGGSGGLAGIFDEVRTGGSFSIQDDYDAGFLVRGELIFAPFTPPADSYLANTVLRPRLHVGGNLATGDEGVSQVYSGLTWTFPVYSNIFVEATFGLTWHDGPLESAGSGLDLGCEILFRESIGVGVDLGQHWRVLVAADHSSHAHLICDDDKGNSGISHAGVFVGYRF